MSRISPGGQDDDPEPDVRVEPLLTTESSLMYFLYEPSVTTVSYFNHRHHDHAMSVVALRQRLRLICNANPWLVGRLIKSRHDDDRVTLVAPRHADGLTETDLSAILCTQDTALSASLDPVSPYADQARVVLASSRAQVPVGYKLLGTDTRVSQFTLVRVDHNDDLALVVSMTHAVVDGYTYYKIMSMLTSSAEIEALSWTRKQEFVPEMQHAMGKPEHDMLVSPGLTLGMVLPNLLCVVCCARQPIVTCAYFVSPDDVARAKAQISSWCSTNDLLTSSFAVASRATLTLMAVNWRTRVPSADTNDAGNYESVMVYDAPSAATPQLIRRSLTCGSDGVYRRVDGHALPEFFALLRAKFAMITNWAFQSFQADLKLRNERDEETPEGMYLHLPVYDSKAILFPVAIVFRPCAGKLAVLYFARHRDDLTRDRLVSSGAPLGDRVDAQIFA